MLVTNGVYRHFKGGLYILETVARHHEKDELWVVYRSFETKERYVRPKDMFTELVDKEKYPYVRQKERFKFIGVAYDMDNEGKEYN